MLAIIIPFYKLRFFEKTLESLANQHNKNFIVYIGDDASPEDPLPLIRQFSSVLKIKYRRFEKNFGSRSLVEQWDRCIELAEDEKWMMILGDDDVLSADVIGSWYSELQNFHIDTNLVRFSTQLIDSEGKPVSDIVSHPVWETAGNAFYRKYKHRTRSSLSEYIFRREQYEKFGFCDYDLAWHSDDRAWLDFADGKPIFTINSSRVFVRISSESISGRTDNLHLKRMAGVQFYRSFIREKLNILRSEQRTEILRKYENMRISAGLMDFSAWLFLFIYYIKYFHWGIFGKFIKRFLKYYF